MKIYVNSLEVILKSIDDDTTYTDWNKMAGHWEERGLISPIHVILPQKEPRTP